jgi:hypothetical protein
VTVIASTGLDGVRAHLAFPGSTDAAPFQDFVEHVVVPALREGYVVVFDNLPMHPNLAVSEAIEHAGARVAAAAMKFGRHADRGDVLEIKEFLRRIDVRARDRLYAAITEVLRQVSTQDALGWFRQAGLCATQL